MFIVTASRHVLAFGIRWFEKAMIEPEVNSRLSFFMHSFVSALGVLILTIAFVCARGDRSGYEFMVAAVGGSGAANAVGRYFTKKADVTVEDDKGEK